MKAKEECLKKLEIGQLALAIDMVEKNELEIDSDIRQAAVQACITSLKRYFHWIIPLFVKTFDIAGEPEINLFATKLITKAIQHGDFPLALVVGQTFNIELDENIKMIARMMVRNQINALGAIVFSGEHHRYSFDL